MTAEAKLLVVDDEFNILELLATSLRFAGFEVVTAGNGREALEAAEREQPDLSCLMLYIMLGRTLVHYIYPQHVQWFLR